jgi:hypothetical protein
MNTSLLQMLILVSGFFLSACSTHKFTDVSGDPGMKDVVGQEFGLKVEGLFYKFSKADTEINLDKAGRGQLPEVKDLSGDFPLSYHGQQILGIAPNGLKFKITRAVRVQSFENDYVVYKAVIVSTGPMQGKEVDPTGLTDREAVPQFDPKYVEPVKGK